MQPTAHPPPSPGPLIPTETGKETPHPLFAYYYKRESSTLGYCWFVLCKVLLLAFTTEGRKSWRLEKVAICGVKNAWPSTENGVRLQFVLTPFCYVSLRKVFGISNMFWTARYVWVLISLWLFLFAAQPKEFFLDELKKLEQRSHKCVELRGEYVE
jgi:hypothetical protein